MSIFVRDAGWLVERLPTMDLVTGNRRPKTTGFVLSSFVGECETGGPIMQKHLWAAIVCAMHFLHSQ